MKYYAIKSKEQSFIENDWEKAKEKMKGLSDIKYKGFSNLEEANAFLENKEILPDTSEPVAYIDGSYNEKTNEYGFGAVLIIDNKELNFYKNYPADEYSNQRNVAGEIKAAGFIIQYAINHNIKKLHIYYDYLGIENWYTGVWKAKSTISIEYRKFRDSVYDKIEIAFHKVKSHTNNKYNDIVDGLAKKAVGI